MPGFNLSSLSDPVTGRFEVVSHYYGSNRSLVAVPGKRKDFLKKDWVNHMNKLLKFFGDPDSRTSRVEKRHNH